MGEFAAVGLDAHKRSVKACAIDTRAGEVSRRGFSGEPGGLKARVGALPGPARVVYESGPTGFWLARLLNEVERVGCGVAATSKIPKAPGERVKTDERDAFDIAALVAGGVELKCARIPALEGEHARDLARGRDDVRRELMRRRQHVDALPLRRGVVWPEGRSSRVREHMQWLARQDLGSEWSQAVYDGAVGQVIETRSRLDGLDKRIEEFAHGSSFAPAVRALECLRGASVLTGFGLAVEIGDWERSASARSFTAFVGLVPSEHSSGQSRVQGSMTKTGNSHARRLLVEAARHHAKPFNPRSAPLLRRQSAQADPLVRATADRANRRLAARWESFRARKKKPVAANGAVARELACFCWELALMAG